MVTRDQRISLQEESQIDMGGPDGATNQIRYFVLVIKNVQESDRGGYMCQLNTNPMKSQTGKLRVVVPPEIIDQESSSDVTVVESANVTLQCKAKGRPNPTIEWRREDESRVPLGASRRILTNKTEGELLDIVRVTRVHSGAWLCIAHNGIMPSVSRRILLNVRCKFYLHFLYPLFYIFFIYLFPFPFFFSLFNIFWQLSFFFCSFTTNLDSCRGSWRSIRVKHNPGLSY